MRQRSVPLIVVASTSASIADDVAARLRKAGNCVYVARSAGGCLRVATSTAPDIVLLDPALPSSLIRFLRAHPATATAQILHIQSEEAQRVQQDEVLRPAFPSWLPASPPAAAGPHAA